MERPHLPEAPFEGSSGLECKKQASYNGIYELSGCRPSPAVCAPCSLCSAVPAKKRPARQSLPPSCPRLVSGAAGGSEAKGLKVGRKLPT